MREGSHLHWPWSNRDDQQSLYLCFPCQLLLGKALKPLYYGDHPQCVAPLQPAPHGLTLGTNSISGGG